MLRTKEKNGHGLPIAGTAILIWASTFFLRYYRFSNAPIPMADEFQYFVIGQNLLNSGRLRYAGATWFTHPPLHYILLTVYFVLTNTRVIGSPTIDMVMQARILTAFFSGLTCVMIFFFLLKICDGKAGIIASTIYAVDPFTMLITRQAYTDTFVFFFTILFLYFTFAAPLKEKSLKKGTLAGVALGLALLTKETAIYVVFTLVTYLFLVRYALKDRNELKKIKRTYIIALIVGFLIYSAYVIWGLSTDPSSFIHEKTYTFERVIGIRRPTGYESVASKSFIDDIFRTLSRYGTTWALLTTAGFCSLYLLIFKRHLLNKNIVMILSYFLGTLSFKVFLQIQNPQFFSYPVVSASLLGGYIFSRVLHTIPQHSSTIKIDAKVKKGFFVTILLIFCMSNMYLWYDSYVVGDSRLAQKVIGYITENVPSGSRIMITWTLGVYLPNKYVVFSAYGDPTYHTLPNVIGKQIQYFVTLYISDPSLLEYLRTNGVLMFYFPSKYLVDGGISIYHVENPI